MDNLLCGPVAREVWTRKLSHGASISHIDSGLPGRYVPCDQDDDDKERDMTGNGRYVSFAEGLLATA